MSPGRARVLLVEDDASIRRYVRLALEDLALDLVEASTLAEARAEMEAAPVTLLLTDLMLPDGHGIELLASAAAGAALRRVVFSAGVDARMRERLQALGVHAVLEKPVSLPALLACVESALAECLPGPAIAGPVASVAAEGSAASATSAAASAALPCATDPTDPIHGTNANEAERLRAIELHFGGDAALYSAFRAAALDQFEADLRAGETALAQADAAALRRVAHNLKSALRLLGCDAPAELARRLESLAAENAAPSRLAAAWQPLGESLHRLRA